MSKDKLHVWKIMISVHRLNAFLLTTGLPLFNITWRPAIEEYHQDDHQLAALSDSNNKTCLTLDHHELTRILFVGSLPVAYRSLYVDIHTNSGSLHFHGETCAHNYTTLMSHAGPKSGQSCRSFCGVPTICNLHTKNRNSAMTTFQFECMCAFQSCTELLLWLWGEPGAFMPPICEIEAVAYRPNWQVEQTGGNGIVV